MAKRWVNSENSDKFYFLGLQNHSDGECSHQMKRHLIFFIRKAMTNLDSILKSRDVTLPAKVYKVTSYGFSSSHVWMLELHYKKGWAPKNWWFWTVVLEKTLESPLDSQESKPVNPRGNQPWERADAKLHQQFDHLTWRASSLGNTLTLGKIKGKRRRQRQRIR